MSHSLQVSRAVRVSGPLCIRIAWTVIGCRERSKNKIKIKSKCQRIRTILGISDSMVYRILTEDLQKTWMHTRWVPHSLSEQNKE